MMTQEINGHIVEAWAVDPATSSEPSLMRIDGKIVCMSSDFPIRLDFPLEYHKNETCIGGEFYITDFNSRPMVFNAKDLLLNAGIDVGNEMGICTNKYLDGFNIEEYVIGISSSLYKIAFIKQVTNTSGFDVVFGSQGCRVGMYSYAYRYVTAEGDRSGWSPVTEQIPVKRRDAEISPEYANAFNYGGIPSASPSSYGNHIRLKYDNTNSFDFIEVRRDAWHNGNTMTTPPVSSIVGAFQINSGLNVVDILDYASAEETEEVLTEEDLIDVPESVQAAKSIRYYNSKLWLMNVKYREKDIDEAINFIDTGDRIFPTIQKIFKKGHVDTYNATYYKANMRGEANGYGIVLYDNAGARSYATSILDNFQMPNRRDPISPDTLSTSYHGAVHAADTNGNAPSLTHEVFDHVDAIDRAVVAGENPPDNFGGLGVQPLLVNILREQSNFFETTPYQTLNPVSQTDSVNDYNRRVNTHVYYNNGYDSEPIDYNPKCFGLDYYSMGAAFRGIETNSLPEWADGFSVVQTPPAMRVIAQGLGFYSLIDTVNGVSENGGKQENELLCNFPDLDPVIGINTQLVSDLIRTHGSASPYRLQVVSPLGFFSEFYSYYSKDLNSTRRAIDAIAHCRILHDEGLINPSWVGVSDLNHYVGFGGWRETTENSTMFSFNTNYDLFVIDEILEAPTQNLTASNLKIRTVDYQPIYTAGYTGGADEGSFISAGMKRWHEPMYVVNLVIDEAQINPGLLTEYDYSGHYIKFKSKILDSDGSASQSAILVSERWEDCIQNINGQIYNGYSPLERFVWVEDASGSLVRWLNVTNQTPAQVGLIQADITANGFYAVTDSSGTYNVYGTFTHTQTSDDTAPIFTLQFNNLNQGDKVFVVYDNRIPVRVFGGDTYVNEHIFPVLDFTYNHKGAPQDPAHEFKFNVPFPYPMYALNAFIGLVGDVTNGGAYSRYLTDTSTANNTTYVLPNILPGHIYFDSTLFGAGDAGSGGFRPSRWRQLVAMWCAETRTNLSFAYNIEADKSVESSQWFPLKNYIYRPGKWHENADPESLPPGGSFFDENHIYDDYYYDYGREHDNWGRGGFRMQPAVNIDYSKKQTTEVITSTPALGFEEEVEFCTRVLWSVTRPINVQDTATVKTFPPANFYDISDNTGEIKFAWDADSQKGNNLYAITNNGVCMLLVDKRILSEINSNELATMGTDLGGVSDELWLNKEIGMDNETWRSWAEYNNVLFWNNSTSAYMMGNNIIKDIAETGYSNMLRTKWIPKANEGRDSKIASVYDILHKEFYSTADNREEFSTLIFGVSQDALQCQSDYQYDKYLSINNKVYGMKDMETYELDFGNILNGDEYECYTTGVSDADSYADKEFIRIRVNSSSKPKRIEFYDDGEAYEAGTPSSIVDAISNPVSIKDYHGYECYIPRKALAPYNRQQGRLCIFKVVSDDDDDFFITTVGVQYKALK
jgi:hypothetical protein